MQDTFATPATYMRAQEQAGASVNIAFRRSDRAAIQPFVDLARPTKEFETERLHKACVSIVARELITEELFFILI
jgi:hypothetical protein